MKKEFTPNTFGVKIIGKIVAMEKADLFSDISKYDMILRDKMTSSYNGNYCFDCDIDIVANKLYYEIDGWKLKSLSFPGNWYGQIGKIVLMNKFGEEVKIDGCGRYDYFTDYETMIRVCLDEFVKFASSTDCFVYSQGDIKFSVTNASSLEKVKDNIAFIDKYIQRFENQLKIIEKQDITEEEKKNQNHS